jgi:O-antigen/teichoic acid export membrane protein
LSDFLLHTNKAVGSLKWTSLIEILSRTATPIVFIALAAFLQPSDFGLLAAATVVISFVQLFVYTGLGPALIQHKVSDIGPAANAAFWVNLILGVVLFLVLELLAPLIAGIFHEQALVPIIRVLSPQVILAAATSVQLCLLTRDFEFKRLMLARLVSAFFPGIISIALAWRGYGVWSLVFGSLVAAVLNAAVTWFGCPWKPSLRVDRAAVQPLLHFGGWNLLENVATWFLLWGDSLIVGSFLGVDELGVYRVACSIALVLFTVVFNPVISILYPYLSRLSGDFVALRDVFTKLSRLVTALALPMALGLLILAPQTVPLVFGNRWMGLGLVLSIVALREGISWLVGINPELYRAVGRPDVNVKVIFIAICFYLPACLIAAPYGLYVFAIVRVIATAGGVLVHVFFTKNLLGVPSTYLWAAGQPVAIACAAMCAVVLGAEVLFVQMTSANLMLSTLTIALLGVAVYVAVLRKVDRDLVSLAMRLLNRAAS